MAPPGWVLEGGTWEVLPGRPWRETLEGDPGRETVWARPRRETLEGDPGRETLLGPTYGVKP